MSALGGGRFYSLEEGRALGGPPGNLHLGVLARSGEVVQGGDHSLLEGGRLGVEGVCG